MSMEGVKEIIGRAILEPAFRKQLTEDPDAAVKGYVLDDEEMALLKELREGSFEGEPGVLAERLSRSSIPGMDELLSKWYRIDPVSGKQ